MRRFCCCGAAPVRPAPVLAPDLVVDLPAHTRDSSANTNTTEKAAIPSPVKDEKTTIEDGCEPKESEKQNAEIISQAPSTPSIHIEDYSEKSSQSIRSVEDNTHTAEPKEEERLDEVISQESIESENIVSRPPSEKSSIHPISERPKSYHSSESIKSTYEDDEPKRVIMERDVRAALAETIIPPRHEDWEAIVRALVEIERLACDDTARAPAASWRTVVRSAAAHVRSLRSRVARAACAALGALFEHRGRILEPEVEEAASALLERCADANRFLRAEAANALGRVACGAGCARAGVALARRGATHRAGAVRAAAAQALARLARHAGPSKILELPAEPRIVVLRAAGELLGDAHPETRLHARHLCVALSEDFRFNQMLKDSMPPSRYRAIEKYVEKLRCR